MDMVNVVLDMKGLSCPRPLIGAKRMVDELSTGQVLLLVSDCPGTQDDLFAWTKQTGNQILKTEKMPDGGTGYYLKKGPARSAQCQRHTGYPRCGLPRPHCGSEKIC